MNQTFLLRIKIILFVIFLTSIISCKVVDNKQQDLIYILQTSFDNVYLAKHGLDYPHTQNFLNKCIEKNDQKCLDAYNQVLNGKNRILSLSNTNSLETTLDIIEKTCLSEDENIANFTCYGGIMSLYFYNSPAQDKIILSRIKKYPKAVKNIIFNHEFLWYHNRPENNVWINYISSVDVNWEQDIQKQFILNMFKKRINQIDGEPWVLR